MDNTATLNAMAFTLSADRPILPTYYISPGSYVLNGTLFDFCESEATVSEDGKSISFYVHDFDETYSDRPLTKEDVEHAFGEFFVYTGEYNDPDVKINSVDFLCFGFTDGSSALANPKYLASANLALAS